MNTNRKIRWLIIGILMCSFSAAAFAQIGIGFSVRFGPPAIPVYSQPICPGSGFLWTPGYWAWDDDAGYYWVPGTWVLAPVGMLWTPGYWGWEDGFYRWRGGYWGPHVGFYGGIDYGFGYTGVGFFGGEWRGGSFFYNRSVMNVNVTRVTNVYERRVEVRNPSRVSYNGGDGGINARPTAEEERYSREPHREALAGQRQQERAASRNRALFASQNHGRPAIAATARPGEFSGRNVVRAGAAGAPYRAPKVSPQQARASRGNGGNEQRNVRNNRAVEQRNANRSTEQRNTARNTADQNASRSSNREQANRDVTRNNSRQQASQARADQKRQQQARSEQKQQGQTARPEQARQQQQQQQGQNARQQQQRQQQARQQQQRQNARQEQTRQQQQQHQAARQEQARQQPAQRAQRSQPQQSRPTQQAQRRPQPEQKSNGRENRGPGR
jgi:WXXGXW repeat (2 copies)